MGYAPGTVYKVLRQVRQRDKGHSNGLGSEATEAEKKGPDPQTKLLVRRPNELARLQADLDALHLEIGRVSERVTEHQSFHDQPSELNLLVDRIGQEVSSLADKVFSLAQTQAAGMT